MWSLIVSFLNLASPTLYNQLPTSLLTCGVVIPTPFISRDEIIGFMGKNSFLEEIIVNDPQVLKYTLNE